MTKLNKLNSLELKKSKKQNLSAKIKKRPKILCMRKPLQLSPLRIR